MKHLKKTLIAGLLATTTLTGCGIISPYTPPIQQGKIISADMIRQIQPGMTPQQVQFILGSPDIQDPFATHQFIYYYSYQARMSAPRESKQLLLTFKDDKLVGIEGDYPPPQEVFGTTPTVATPDLSLQAPASTSTQPNSNTSATIDEENAAMPKQGTQVNAPHQTNPVNPNNFTTDVSDNSATPDDADTNQTPLSVNL